MSQIHKQRIKLPKPELRNSDFSPKSQTGFLMVLSNLWQWTEFSLYKWLERTCLITIPWLDFSLLFIYFRRWVFEHRWMLCWVEFSPDHLFLVQWLYWDYWQRIVLSQWRFEEAWLITQYSSRFSIMCQNYRYWAESYWQKLERTCLFTKYSFEFSRVFWDYRSRIEGLRWEFKGNWFFEEIQHISQLLSPGHKDRGWGIERWIKENPSLGRS